MFNYMSCVRINLYNLIYMSQYDLNPTHKHELPPYFKAIVWWELCIINVHFNFSFFPMWNSLIPRLLKTFYLKHSQTTNYIYIYISIVISKTFWTQTSIGLQLFLWTSNSTASATFVSRQVLLELSSLGSTYWSVLSYITCKIARLPGHGFLLTLFVVFLRPSWMICRLMFGDFARHSCS